MELAECFTYTGRIVASLETESKSMPLISGHGQRLSHTVRPSLKGNGTELENSGVRLAMQCL